jgi:hypothetical protein
MTRAALHGGERLGCHGVKRKIAGIGASNHPAAASQKDLEDFLPTCQHVVQRVLKV